MIVRAAIKYLLCPRDDASKEIVLPLHRHGDGGKILKDLGFSVGDFKIIEQGFITDTGEFLSRRAAAEHAYECGQLTETAEEPRIDCLMSEDLW